MTELQIKAGAYIARQHYGKRKKSRLIHQIKHSTDAEITELMRLIWK